jgi:hypothetical protein
VRALPPSPYFVRWQGGPYYMHDGAWYRPYHSHFVVVTPPVGLFVPALPRFYTTIWVGGAPYYYADESTTPGVPRSTVTSSSIRRPMRAW